MLFIRAYIARAGYSVTNSNRDMYITELQKARHQGHDSLNQQIIMQLEMNFGNEGSAPSAPNVLSLLPRSPRSQGYRKD